MKKSLSIAALLLLLWNPVTLTVLLKSGVWGIAVSCAVLLVGLLISTQKSLRIKVWAFNVAAILSIAYHAELLFRVFGAEKDIPNLYQLYDRFYFNRPFLEQKFVTDEYVSYYRTNCQGFRIDELTNPNDSLKCCDWLFIGDSFTQGAQVDYEELFTTLIYKDFPDKTIVNAGISGAGLYEELNFYKQIGSKLHPKIVFLQIGVFNDFLNVYEHKASFQDYLTEISSLYRYLSYNLSYQEELPLGRWMEPFFTNLQDNIDNNILYKPTSEVKEHDKHNFRECIAKFKECVEANGGELVLILLPCKEQVSDDMLKKTLKACHLKKEDIDMMAASRLCRDVATEEGLKMIDLYDDFRSSAFPFFEVDEHLNYYGHKIIANRFRQEYESASNRYNYISQKNRNERYPSMLNDSVSIVFQSQDKDHYLICNKLIGDDNIKTIWTGVKELIHPSISNHMDYLVFTEGNQELHQTDIVLYSFVQDKKVIINSKGSGAAIPMFNYQGTQIVYPSWDSATSSPYITVYDIALSQNIYSFHDGAECWRPIFSKDGHLIYYICREESNGHFLIKSYTTESKEKSIVLKTDYEIWDIALSPSGNYIAYAGNKDGNWDLFLYSLNDGSVFQLTHTLGNEWDPSFGTSDKDLWFAGEFGVNNGIYRMTIE